ncbi:ATP-dependent nuclease [Flagellimonas okinawensis]|uniref:AAA family ATPase n=1 Tax=Flagellimonas okinawensis TaxID=3031324 RepID=A0ABT5XM47_9FLAO|nr:AAA family ATPase [[Muricauda] okinawensis]MDF0706965.1 AAA family ATPase [[Muricauda] okinawensis]
MELIEVIQAIKSSGQFKNYIDFIQFPFYRNVEIDTRITFDFPLTVFIGQNGCGKSSCLHALYGAPDRYTPYKFWFDTKVDPVSYYDDQRKRHSFWYSYQKGNQTFEVIKARIKRKDDPNYWETSRPLAWAGMTTRSNKNERDKPVIKNVVYLDFRSELSAFDKYFYFGNLKFSRARNKQEYLRRKSASLNKIFTGAKATISSSTRALNMPMEELSGLELEWISFILGRKYISGLSVLHELFRNKGYSVLFQTNFAKYSEAVAGSGEMAVVRLVREVLAAENYSLILLDEPEVSLHPGAQHRLKVFLLNQIRNKKHQIVLTSHSPSIVKGLPKESIKVFYQNPSNGRFLVKENLIPEEAFFHIEFPIDNRKNIVVEDILAKEIVEGVLDKMGEETRNLFNVKFNPGGESVIKKEFITVYCREQNMKDYVFFDGDQKPENPHLDWRSISTSDQTIDHLKSIIREQCGEEIKFSVDGGLTGGNQNQQLELLKSYLDFYLTNVFYLPRHTPEDIVWSQELAEYLIKGVTPNIDTVEQTLVDLSRIGDTKLRFAFVSKVVQGESSADSIYAIHKQFIQRWLNIENEDFELIKGNLESILNRT